jgi:hypothetical protein
VEQFVAQTGAEVFDEAILPWAAGEIDTKPLVGDAAQHVGETSLRATLCADQGVVGCGALTAAVGSGE